MTPVVDSVPWREKPLPELVRLAWPIAVSMLSYAVMTLVDTLFVARLGASALAGVGLGGAAAFTILGFGFGLLRAVKVLVSQAAGAGDRARAAAALWAGVWTALAMGVLMLLAGRAIAPHLHLVAASDAAAAHAETYVAIRMLGTPCVLLYVALREARYGVGDTRSAMWAAVAANVANVALDWVLIVELEAGVAGAAWATVAGHALEAAVVVAAQARAPGGLRPVRPRWADVRALFALGLPTGVQFWLEIGSFALLTVIVAALGDGQMAAHQIALQVVHFSFLPAMAIGEAASVLAGRAVGARAVRLVRRVAHVALGCATAYMAACTLAILACARWIVGSFGVEPAVQATAVSLLWMAALFQLADGAAVVARGVLRGAGDVRVPAAIGIACAWLCTPPLAFLLGQKLGLGALGGWIGLTLEITASAAIYWWRLERGGWVGWARRARARLRPARVALLPA